MHDQHALLRGERPWCDAPSVGPAPHDISPPLESQLVLKLECRIALPEDVEILPCGCSRCVTLPVNEHLLNIASEARADDMSGRHVPAQGRRRHGGWPARQVEQPELAPRTS